MKMKRLLVAFLLAAIPALAQPPSPYPTPTFQSTTILGGGAFTGTFTGNHTYSGNLTFQGTSALNGATTIGTSSAAANLIQNGQAGSNRTFFWQTAGVNRWRMLADATAESGSDAGTRWALCGQHDAGTNNFCAITIDRKYGAIQFATANPITLSGADPGTVLSTQGMRWDQRYTGTTTGVPLQYNLFWIRRDDVNDHSQGVALQVQDEAACSGLGACAPDLSFNGTIVGNVPADGAVTPVVCVPFSGGVAQANYDALKPATFSTGITAVVSTATTCFTKTTGFATAFLSGLVQ